MRLFLHVMVAVCMVVHSAAAEARDWIVDKVTQPAEYTLDAVTWNSIEAGMEVPNESWIKTGRRGRLILRRQQEMIQFKSNTVASISSQVTGLWRT